MSTPEAMFGGELPGEAFLQLIANSNLGTPEAMEARILGREERVLFETEQQLAKLDVGEEPEQ